MQQPYQPSHWSVFAKIPHVAAGRVGFIPEQWADNHALRDLPTKETSLPTCQLDREQVRKICQNPDLPVLFGYICAMAWGLQGAGPGGAKHVTAAWAARAALIPKLLTLRDGALKRGQAYDLFTGANAVQGLGPAYFTKLLYFFHPSPHCYIMDQWTAKSVNLLTGNWVVRMVGDAVSNLNKCGNYQAYCEEVDAMAALLGVRADDCEEMLMSKGGHNPWPWRAYVRAKWVIHAPVSRYSRSGMHSRYPHITDRHF